MARNLIFLAIMLLPLASFSATEYEIEAAVNDETFVINGEVFKAQTYCPGWVKGDYIIFLEGSAFGACAMAKLYNTSRKESCDVWCE